MVRFDTIFKENEEMELYGNLSELPPTVLGELIKINSSLNALSSQQDDLKDKVKEISEKTDLHHDKLLIISTGASIFWQRVFPNVGWVIAGATMFAEIRKVIGH